MYFIAVLALTLQRAVVSTYISTALCVLSTECIYGFRIIVKIYIDYLPEQNSSVGPCNRETCVLFELELKFLMLLRCPSSTFFKGKARTE